MKTINYICLGGLCIQTMDKTKQHEKCSYSIFFEFRNGYRLYK